MAKPSEDDRLTQGHRLVVLVPPRLLARLRAVTAQRAVTHGGHISMGAVVRELLEEALDAPPSVPVRRPRGTAKIVQT